MKQCHKEESFALHWLHARILPKCTICVSFWSKVIKYKRDIIEILQPRGSSLAFESLKGCNTWFWKNVSKVELICPFTMKLILLWLQDLKQYISFLFVCLFVIIYVFYITIVEIFFSYLMPLLISCFIYPINYFF